MSAWASIEPDTVLAKDSYRVILEPAA